MKYKIVAISDTGKERTNNEDAFIICPDLSKQNWSLADIPEYTSPGKLGSLLVVADGMGGANAGEIASSVAIKSIQHTFSKENVENALKENNIEGLLHSSIKKADKTIKEKMWEEPDTSGMGTTIVVCWVIGDTAHIAWCGDSRCYVYNPYNGLKQLTKDHSLVQELVDKGVITEEEVFTHPDNNIITRGLGDFDEQAPPEIVKCPLRENDIILLCSDGLCGYCTNKEIEDVVEKNYTDIIKCRDQLLQLALDAGGYDNICIALASLIGDNQNSPSQLSICQKFLIRLKRVLTRKPSIR